MSRNYINRRNRDIKAKSKNFIINIFFLGKE